MWGQGYGTPTTDSVQSYTDVTKSINNGVYSFTAYRAANTGDASQDTVIPCGTTQTYSWAV